MLKSVFMVAAALAANVSASASEVVLMEITSHGLEVVGASLSVDRKANAAFVTIGTFDRNLNNSICSSNPYACSSNLSNPVGLRSTRIDVKGLTFDAAASQIVYTSEGGVKTVCGTVIRKKILFSRYDAVKPTGACKLSYRRNYGWPQTVKLIITE